MSLIKTLVRSRRQANKEGSIELSIQQEMVWKTLKGKPPKSPYLWEIRPNSRKRSRQKHVQNLKRDSQQEPSFHQRDLSIKHHGMNKVGLGPGQPGPYLIV